MHPRPDLDMVAGVDAIGGLADAAVAAIQTRDGEPIDFQDVMFRFTLDAATDFLMGSCAHSLRALAPGVPPQPGNFADKFARALANVQRRLGQRSRMAPLWPLAEMFGDKTK